MLFILAALLFFCVRRSRQRRAAIYRHQPAVDLTGDARGQGIGAAEDNTMVYGLVEPYRPFGSTKVPIGSSASSPSRSPSEMRSLSSLNIPGVPPSTTTNSSTGGASPQTYAQHQSGMSTGYAYSPATRTQLSPSDSHLSEREFFQQAQAPSDTDGGTLQSSLAPSDAINSSLSGIASSRTGSGTGTYTNTNTNTISTGTFDITRRLGSISKAALALPFTAAAPPRRSTAPRSESGTNRQSAAASAAVLAPRIQTEHLDQAGNQNGNRYLNSSPSRSPHGGTPTGNGIETPSDTKRPPQPRSRPLTQHQHQYHNRPSISTDLTSTYGSGMGKGRMNVPGRETDLGPIPLAPSPEDAGNVDDDDEDWDSRYGGLLPPGYEQATEPLPGQIPGQAQSPAQAHGQGQGRMGASIYS